ncbi:MAG: hypothetical protein WBL06_11810 [Pseudolysinimonas sp.]|uniref:hypothetical protein n=1 Tax=Pseudolysinimonas sp. TaxID=2680009 RepID=UPI003C720239
MSSATNQRFRRFNRRALGLTAGAFILLMGVVISPLAAGPSLEEQRAEYAARYAQEFEVPVAHAVLAASTSALSRDTFGATPGPETFIQGGTNYDWAKLVLVYAGWPITDSNVTVILRWMRQENGPPDWYRRNNPLNIGAGGFASYSSLDESARVVAKALTTSGMYSEIAAGFAASADTATIEYAIWASPWAGGNYAWGGHWSYRPVEVVAAPRSAWGS